GSISGAASPHDPCGAGGTAMPSKPIIRTIHRTGVARGAALCAGTLAMLCGTAVASSNTALLVRCDLKPDGVINFADFNMFLNAFAKQDPTADVNADGRVNDADLRDFTGKLGQRFEQVAPSAPPAPTTPPAPSNPPKAGDGGG